MTVRRRRPATRRGAGRLRAAGRAPRKPADGVLHRTLHGCSRGSGIHPCSPARMTRVSDAETILSRPPGSFVRDRTFFSVAGGRFAVAETGGGNAGESLASCPAPSPRCASRPRTIAAPVDNPSSPITRLGATCHPLARILWLAYGVLCPLPCHTKPATLLYATYDNWYCPTKCACDWASPVTADE